MHWARFWRTLSSTLSQLEGARLYKINRRLRLKRYRIDVVAPALRTRDNDRYQKAVVPSMLNLGVSFLTPEPLEQRLSMDFLNFDLGSFMWCFLRAWCLVMCTD